MSSFLDCLSSIPECAGQSTQIPCHLGRAEQGVNFFRLIQVGIELELKGRGVFEKIIPRDFIEGEYQDLQKLFKGLDGDWSGNAQVLGCKETDGEVRGQMENYSIKSEGTLNSRGQFVFKSDLYSMEKKTTHHEIFRLYLSEEKLATEPGIADADIELISVSSLK